jgi:hypothetical protein
MGAGNCERRKCAQIGGILGSRRGKPGKGKAKEVTETLQWNPVGWTPTRHGLAIHRKRALHSAWRHAREA